MSIKEVMAIGCEGMSAEQVMEEQERRIKVCERINKLDGKIKKAEDKAKAAYLKREFKRIKAEERSWLLKAAWFIY